MRSLLVLALLVGTLRGQDLRGVLSGQVLDASGRAIAGARMELTEVATGVNRGGASNAAGYYTFPFLSPGVYALVAEAAGFKQLQRSGIELTASTRLRVDLKLEVGSAAEVVTVEGDADPLRRDDPAVGSAISRTQIVDLPNNGRNIYQMVWSAAGVTKTSTYWGSIENYATGNATNVQINGGVRRENETVLDGVSDTLPNRDVAFQPPLESVQEVRVQTNTYDAAYGRLGGGVVAVVTKAGTAAFHGTLHETNKSSALGANSWLANSLNQGKQRFVNNTFGFQAGGPVPLARLKHRLFFMQAYEGLRERSSGDATALVPTAQQRQGDYSGFARILYDPLTTRVSSGQAVRSVFSGNRIPANRLDPVAQAALKFVPLPNLPGAGFPNANYLSRESQQNDYNQILSRVDVRPSARDALYGSYGSLPYQEFGSILFGANSPAEPSATNPLHRNFYRGVADWTHLYGVRTTLNLRAGIVRYVNTRGNPAAVGFDPRALGFASSLVDQFGFLQFPQFTIGGYATIGPPLSFQRDACDSWSFQANVSRLSGAHRLHAGAEMRLYKENLRTPGRASGQYGFTRAFTQSNPTRADAASGDEAASFLLGYPASGAVDRNIDPAFAGRYTALFVQDEWKLHPRWMLSMGLRWDYERPYAERYNRMERGFAFDQASPLPGLKGGLLYAGQAGEQRLAYAPDRNNVQPRVGVVFQATRTVTLRFGYGLYYLGGSGGQPTTGFSQATTLVSSLDGGNTPRVTLANAFPERLLSASGSSLGLATALGQAVTFANVARVLPYSHQLSAGLRFQVADGWIAEASYSKNATRRYPVTASLNAIPRSELGRPDAYYRTAVPNPLAGLIPGNAAKNGATILRQELLLPYPQFAAVNMTDVPIGRNDTHALQTQLSRQFRRGLSVSAAFTISKTLEQLSFLNPQDFDATDYDRSRLEKRLAQFDVPRKFSLMSLYQLPLGQGRLRSGWQINGNLTLQSGFPVDFPNAPNLAARSAALSGDQVQLTRAFDTSLFPTIAPNLQYNLRTFPTRFPDVRLRPLQNLDLSLSKRTALSETVALEIRAEFLNATNHPWFSRLDTRGADVTSSQFGWYQLEEQNQNRLIALVAKITW